MAMKMDPATGQMYDDEDVNEIPTGLVGQQEGSAGGNLAMPAGGVTDDNGDTLDDILAGHSNANQPEPEPMDFEPMDVGLGDAAPVSETGFDPALYGEADPETGLPPVSVQMPTEDEIKITGPMADASLDNLGQPGNPEDQNGLETPEIGEPSVAPEIGEPSVAPEIGAPDGTMAIQPPGRKDGLVPPLSLAPIAGPVGKGAPAPLALSMPGEPGAPLPESETPVELPDVSGDAPPAPVLTRAQNQAQITKDAIANRNLLTASDTEVAKATAAHASEVAKIKDQAKKDADQIIKDGQDRLAANRVQQQADHAKYRAMGEKGIWEDNPTRNAVLAGIALILGGRNGAHFMIGAVNGLEEKKKTEMALLAKQMEMNGAEASEIREATTQQMADWKNKQSAGLESAAARAEAELAAKGVPRVQIAANKDIIAIRQKAQDAAVERDKLDAKAAEQKIKDDMAALKTKAQIDLSEANTRLANARTHKLGGGKGGGGGGAGGSLADSAQKVADAITAGVVQEDGTRRELHYGEKIALARANHIPINGKSSETTLDSINKTSAFDANQERKGLKDDPAVKEVTAQMGKFRNEALGTARTLGPVRVLSSVEAMRKGLDEAIASGDPSKIKAAAVKAKEQAGTLMSGGKLTNAQIKILETLESKTDHLAAEFGKWTGDPTEGKGLLKRLQLVVDDAGTEIVAQIADVRQRAMDQHLAPGTGIANTPAARERFLALNDGLFSSVKWHGKPVFDEGKRSTARQSAVPAEQAAAPAPAKVLPIETAKDKLMLARAIATKPGDPDYEDAQIWKRAHGR